MNANGNGLHTELLPIGLIVTSPNNPRKHFDETKLAELAESARAKGILQPILVRPVTRVIDRGPLKGKHEAYELVAGERRFRAAGMAGLTEIPARIVEMSDKDADEARVIENEQREDLGPLEKAEGYRLLIERYDVTVEDLAPRIGKSPATIYGLLKLADAPAIVQEAVANGTLPSTTAQLICRVPNAKLREKAAKDVLKPQYRQGPLSFRDASEWIRRHYMVELKTAPFSRKSLDLVPTAGACTACPKMTANNRRDFPDARGDVCTDPSCFQAKVKAHQEQLIRDAKESGKKVLPAKEAEKIFADYGGGLKYDAPYVDLAEQCHEVNKSPSYKRLVGEQLKEEIVLARNQRGELRELAPKARVQEILRKEHGVKTRTGSNSREDAAWKKRQAEEAAKKKLDRKRCLLIMEEVEHQANGMADRIQWDGRNETLLALIVKGMVRELWHDLKKILCRRRGLEGDKKKHPDALLAAEVDRMSAPELVAFLAEIVACRRFAFDHGYGWDRADPEGYGNKAFLEFFKIDPKEMTRRAKEAPSRRNGKPDPDEPDDEETDSSPASASANGTGEIVPLDQLLEHEADEDAAVKNGVNGQHFYAWELLVSKHGGDQETVVYVAKTQEAAKRKAYLISRACEVEVLRGITQEEYRRYVQSGAHGKQANRHRRKAATK